MQYLRSPGGMVLGLPSCQYEFNEACKELKEAACWSWIGPMSTGIDFAKVLL